MGEEGWLVDAWERFGTGSVFFLRQEGLLVMMSPGELEPWEPGLTGNSRACLIKHYIKMGSLETLYGAITWRVKKHLAGPARLAPFNRAHLLI